MGSRVGLAQPPGLHARVDLSRRDARVTEQLLDRRAGPPRPRACGWRTNAAARAGETRPAIAASRPSGRGAGSRRRATGGGRSWRRAARAPRRRRRAPAGPARCSDATPAGPARRGARSAPCRPCRAPGRSRHRSRSSRGRARRARRSAGPRSRRARASRGRAPRAASRRECARAASVTSSRSRTRGSRDSERGFGQQLGRVLGRASRCGSCGRRGPRAAVSLRPTVQRSRSRPPSAAAKPRSRR